LLHISPTAEWDKILRDTKSQVPEAFTSDHRVLNLFEGEWTGPGAGRHYESAIDGRSLGNIPMLDLSSARSAVKFAKSEAADWAAVDLDERKRRVSLCLEGLREQRELIALLLVWEIGKPHAQALTDIDRCISGVEWYVDNIESMLGKRKPLGLISNIASWNYPLSVLMHAVLVQVLAGNASISKTPSDGGLYALTVAHAIARRAGLPVSLVSGSGGQLSEALVRNEYVDCLAFVGGKTNGSAIASSLYDGNKRYLLEMEGVNAYGVWSYSDWPALAQQIRKGFDYGKQRCTAYARYVIQRSLFPQFLEMYLPVLRSLQFVVDHIEELISEMNVSNGSLVSSIACDDPATAKQIAGQLRGFKIGVNTVRSRGDREEVFGGIGQSWKGCFVGGRYLVLAVTAGEPGEKLYGNFPEYTQLPEQA